MLTNGRSVKPFVAGVELGKHEDQNFHAANRTMTSTGTNQHTHARMHVYEFVAELHLGIRLTAEEEVGFRELLVVVQTGVRQDLRDMDGSGKVFDVRKTTSRCSARARHTVHLIEVDDFVAGADR